MRSAVCLLVSLCAPAHGLGMRRALQRAHAARGQAVGSTVSPRPFQRFGYGAPSRLLRSSPSDDEAEPEVSREAKILESIDGSSPTNFIIPPFARTALYCIFGLSAAAGIAIGTVGMKDDFGKAIVNVGTNAAFLVAIAGVAFFDNKQRSASLREVQRQLDTEYLKKDSPFYFDTERRKTMKAAQGSSNSGSGNADDDDDDDEIDG